MSLCGWVSILFAQHLLMGASGFYTFWLSRIVLLCVHCVSICFSSCFQIWVRLRAGAGGVGGRGPWTVTLTPFPFSAPREGTARLTPQVESQGLPRDEAGTWAGRASVITRV